jgi:hypothetical protein
MSLDNTLKALSTIRKLEKLSLLMSPLAWTKHPLNPLELTETLITINMSLEVSGDPGQFEIKFQIGQLVLTVFLLNPLDLMVSG